jgi:hypothetical protein
MVLSYSRAIFLRFFPGQQLAYFLMGHEEAFHRWQGVPRRLAYDNLKSVVLDRVGNAIRFNPQLLSFAGHYRYEPRPVAPYRGNEKGRVERAIRYVRDNFIPARSFESIEDINRQADQWCTSIAIQRRWPEDRRHTVGEALERDRQALRPLPEANFPCHERKEVRAGKTPYVRFDLNDYSVPHDRVQRTLVVLADLNNVRVLDGLETVATHRRSFDKGAQVEEPAHVDALREHKRLARGHSLLDHLHRACPSVAELLSKAAERGASLVKMTTQLRGLLDLYGAADLERALRVAVEHDAPHIGAVQQILETNRKARGQPPPVSPHFGDDPRVRDIVVQPHDIKAYNHLLEDSDDDDTAD